MNGPRAAVKQVWPRALAATMPEDGWQQAQVLVATVQGLRTKLEQIPPDRFGLVVVDGAHYSPAASWEKVISHFRPRLLLGCTATPTRLDGKELGDVFGRPPLFEYGLAQAMADGYLVPVRQYGIFSSASLADVPGRPPAWLSTSSAWGGACVSTPRATSSTAWCWT